MWAATLGTLHAMSSGEGIKTRAEKVAAEKLEAQVTLRMAAAPRFRFSSSIPGWKLLRSLGGVGLVLLGVVDSSVIPKPLASKPRSHN